MKKLFLIVLLLTVLAPTTKATHIVGGELNYLYLGNDNYEIRLTVYRDCANGNPAAIFSDSIANLIIYFNFYRLLLISNQSVIIFNIFFSMCRIAHCCCSSCSICCLAVGV